MDAVANVEQRKAGIGMLAATKAFIAQSSLALALIAPTLAAAQEEKAAAPAVRAAVATPSGASQAAVVGPDGKPVQPAKPGDDAKPGEKPPMSGEQPGENEKKEPEAPQAITRPENPAEKADPQELNVHADEDGMVEFSFNGQKWDDVLEWLAFESGMSLDWQTLPGDYFNFTTPRKYSLVEARDVINRHLLARGYTLLAHEGALQVVDVKLLNPAQVPRIEPGDLAQRTPYEFVKVSFPLTWMVADQAVAEVTPMLSPNHKISALKTTNRLEIMDAVINLRDVNQLLQLEQSPDSQESLVQEFQLLYTRADDVREQLLGVLGLESKSGSGGGGGGGTSQQLQMMQQQMQQQMQQMQQRMAQQQQQQGKGGAVGPSTEAKVNIVADMRRNVIVAHAPPDKLAVIEQTIRVIDQPTGRVDSLEAYVARTQVYRLASIDPQQLVASLKEMGGLDPRTRLTVDDSNDAVIAYATPLDHYSIGALVKKLDGSARKTRVISLRRLRADLVAGSIDYLIGSGQKQEDSNRNRYPYYFYSSRYDDNDRDKKSDKFRVTANVESNQLLLWANEVEYEQVLDMLVQLGEVRVRGGSGDIVRVIDTSAGAGTAQFLEELKRKWESLGENELLLPSQEELQRLTPPAKDDENEDKPTKEKESAPPTDPPADRSTHAAPPGDALTSVNSRQFLTGLLADDQQTENEQPPGQPAEQPQSDAPPAEDFPLLRNFGENRPTAVPPKISISIDPQGRLVISSRDTQALDRLEELMSQLAPPRAGYRIFYLDHAPAYWVRLNLEDFFEEDMEKGSSDSGDDWYRGWYGIPPSNKNDDPTMLLAQRPPLKFIDDLDTNSILVKNASPDQLHVIGELIEVYDVPVPEDTQSARVTKLFSVRFSKARVIAETIKDAYRDLLSSNDKALQSNNNQQQNQRPDSGTTFISNYGGFRGTEKEEEDAPEQRPRITFKGKLSIGIDEYTNTLLVSAEGEALMNVVGNMIQDLDEAAKPVGRMQVVRLGAGVNSEHVREILSKLVTDQRQQQAQHQPQQQQNQGQPGQPNQPFSPQQNGRAAAAQPAQ